VVDGKLAGSGENRKLQKKEKGKKEKIGKNGERVERAEKGKSRYMRLCIKRGYLGQTNTIQPLFSSISWNYCFGLYIFIF
jgi:hypothetical protein